MKIILTIMTFICLLAVSASAQNYQIDWYVIASGGGHAESATYQIDGTIGQPIVGQSSSPTYTVEAGYWVGVGEEISLGYQYLPGDANMYNGIWPPQCIGSDVTYLVGYFRGVSANQPCYLDDFWASADANGDCNIIGSDVTRLVNYFRGNVTLLYCVDYEPAWPTPDDLPDSAPSGWPNCETPVISRVIPSGAFGE